MKNAAVVDRNVFRLDSICRIVQGGRHKLSGKHFIEDGGYPAYGAGGYNGNLPSYEFDKPAVVLSAIGARCGKCFQPSGRWSSLANTTVFFPDEQRVDVRFLWYQLNDESSWHRSGTAQPYIRPSDIKAREVYLPPLAEQKRISAILDAAGDLRAKRRESLAQLDTLLQSVFLDMFGDPVINPMHWEVVEMAEVVSGKHGIKAGPFGSALKKQDYASSGYRVYGQEQVIAGRLDVGDYYIDEGKYRKLRGCAVAAGDILVSLVGSYGRVLIVPEDAPPGIINPRLLKITPRHDVVTSLYLASLIKNESTQRELKRLSHGGTMGILNTRLLKRLRVSVPPLDLQHRFATIVESVEKQKSLMRAHLAELDTLFASLQQRAFNGEL